MRAHDTPHSRSPSAQIETLRQLVPDASKVAGFIAGLGTMPHPIACDYLDHHCPNWRLRLVVNALHASNPAHMKHDPRRRTFEAVAWKRPHTRGHVYHPRYIKYDYLPQRTLELYIVLGIFPHLPHTVINHSNVRFLLRWRPGAFVRQTTLAAHDPITDAHSRDLAPYLARINRACYGQLLDDLSDPDTAKRLNNVRRDLARYERQPSNRPHHA